MQQRGAPHGPKKSGTLNFLSHETKYYRGYLFSGYFFLQCNVLFQWAVIDKNEEISFCQNLLVMEKN